MAFALTEIRDIHVMEVHYWVTQQSRGNSQYSFYESNSTFITSVEIVNETQEEYSLSRTHQ